MTIRLSSPLWLLTLLFVALKLTGAISWSWWWVTVPIWGLPAFLLAAFAVVASIVMVALVVVAICVAVDSITD